MQDHFVKIHRPKISIAIWNKGFVPGGRRQGYVCVRTAQSNSILKSTEISVKVLWKIIKCWDTKSKKAKSKLQ